jgi:hypothetical protein
MATEKIIVGPINKGLRTDREPFIIDNDSFPTLVNAYQWRGRVKRKRGTSLLGRLNRFFNSTQPSSTGIVVNPTFTITFDGAGNANLLGPYTNSIPVSFSLQANAAIVPGSVTIVGSIGPVTYTDPTEDGYLTPTGTGGPNTINYSTGAILIPAQAGGTATVQMNYYPDLPVMGLEEMVLSAQQFPQCLAFDTVYSYQILTTSPYKIYDVSFYDNPSTASVTYPSGFAGVVYAQKTFWTPLTWSGSDYQQFNTCNYAGAIWATNSKPGMQFQLLTSVTYSSSTQLTLVVPTNINLVKGDWIFINEVTGTNSVRINQQTGYVDATPVTAAGSTTFTVTFPYCNFTSNAYMNGMIQYLTNLSPANPGDGIRFYSGDPTMGGVYPPSVNGVGWVNFAPPLSQGSYSIDIYPAAQYYLVGATVIYAYRGFLMFFAPYIQTSTGSPILLQDTILFSQNGTPFYTASFDNSSAPFYTGKTYNALLVPSVQSATPQAFWEDVTGFGGYQSSGVAQQIQTVVPNEDVLIVGYPRAFTRLIYTGNNLIPFLTYRINTELGAGSTFSSIIFDQGSFTLGNFGFVLCGQVSAKRIDLSIIDSAFEINYMNNGAQRVTAARDYVNEWVYVTYCSNQVPWKFPNQTLQYNYRDDTWAIFNECYTTYGTFSRASGNTWATLPYESWATWRDPWNAGQSTLLMPEVIGGNQQGFVLFRAQGTNEDPSGYIQAIYGPVTITGATQANPCVLTANNTFIAGISVMITDVMGMTQLNNNTYTVTAVTPTTVTINVDSTGFSAYVSGGVATPTSNIYSANHCLNEVDPESGAPNYILINGALGTIGAQVNGKIFSVDPITDSTLSLNPPIPAGSYTYFGNATFTRMYVPYIQTKQFPVSWAMARKTRIGTQSYLLTRTDNAQITLLIFLSENSDTPFNNPEFPASVGIVPENSQNNALIYSTVLYTCQESTNLGLTPANISLSEITEIDSDNNASIGQAQIWHRMNTSLVGDTIQVGFTLNDGQMRSLTINSSSYTITAATNQNPCILTFSTNPTFVSGNVINISGVMGMTQLIGNYQVLEVSGTEVIINIDASRFGVYTTGGVAYAVAPINQFDEIELHSFIISVSPSSVLA